MTKKKSIKLEEPKIDFIRYSEYYNMIETFDNLYAKSKSGEVFTDLMSIILKDENILLAYRNVKANKGSFTPGADKLTIDDISKLTTDEVISEVKNRFIGHKKIGYQPKPVIRRESIKSNGSARPLGIPSIWDRLIQQCIKQILEPICEAKFSNHSYGFRPMRSTEHAMAELYKHIQKSNFHHMIEINIKSFYDEVNHSKLIKQLWSLGIRDTSLIYRIKSILKAPIKSSNGEIVYLTKGIYQSGILTSLLCNIVLNELDHWIESQWEEHPMVYKTKDGSERKMQYNKNGSLCKGPSYTTMRKTNLKEMYIVRYADDFRILCKTRDQAKRTQIAIIQWLRERLKLEVSPDETRIVNLKKRFSEFLGFKIKVKPKNNDYAVTSHVSDKQLKNIRKKLTDQAKKIARPKNNKNQYEMIRLYNSMVTEFQDYYRLATDINIDFCKVNRSVMTVLTNRLGISRLKRNGRELNDFEKDRYGDSKMMRYILDIPIYPIGYIQTKFPMFLRYGACAYTSTGREGLHKSLNFNNTYLIPRLTKRPIYDQSMEFADNYVFKFSFQKGKCAITGIEFCNTDEIHCHHIIPKEYGGTDNYDNLVLVLKPIHELIHAVKQKTIEKYLKTLNLDEDQLKKINELRKSAKRNLITV